MFSHKHKQDRRAITITDANCIHEGLFLEALNEKLGEINIKPKLS